MEVQKPIETPDFYAGEVLVPTQEGYSWISFIGWLSVKHPWKLTIWMNEKRGTDPNNNDDIYYESSTPFVKIGIHGKPTRVKAIEAASNLFQRTFLTQQMNLLQTLLNNLRQTQINFTLDAYYHTSQENSDGRLN